MKIVAFLLISTVIIGATNCMAGDFQRDFEIARPALRLDEQRLTAINRFATLARNRDRQGLLEMFVPAARAGEGDASFLQYIDEKIIPFFSSYQKMHTYRTVEPRTLPDDSTGYRYYTYFTNESGTQVPFDIIVTEVNGNSLIANFNARGCIKGKHPICK